MLAEGRDFSHVGRLEVVCSNMLMRDQGCKAEPFRHEIKSQYCVDPVTASQNLFVRRYTATGVLELSLKPAWRMKGLREACIPG